MYPGWGSDFYMSEVEFAVFSQFYDTAGNETLTNAYDELLAKSQANAPKSERRAALKAFRDILYSDKYRDKILAAMNQEKNFGYDPADLDFENNPNDNFVTKYPTWDAVKNEFSYYQNLWEQINKAGGCETIDEQYIGGDEGTEWFNNMVTSGLVSIYMLNPNKDDWEVTTIATSVGNNYLQEVNDEEKAKKAEAEYEHEMRIINRKDTKFDTALKKLETEENACKTEIESIKKVKDENIDRTFNLFS